MGEIRAQFRGNRIANNTGMRCSNWTFVSCLSVYCSVLGSAIPESGADLRFSFPWRVHRNEIETNKTNKSPSYHNYSILWRAGLYAFEPVRDFLALVSELIVPELRSRPVGVIFGVCVQPSMTEPKNTHFIGHFLYVATPVIRLYFCSCIFVQ